MTGWRNRITGGGQQAPQDLLANPQNWRIHSGDQQRALSAMLDEVGWVEDVVVNTTTGHILDGHLRVQLALRQEEPTVPVTYVELSEPEERLALATLDPTASFAEYDPGTLQDLLADIQTGNAELQELFGQLANETGITQGAGTLEGPVPVEPTTVLDSRRGEWPARKRAWQALGIESELGRDGALLYQAGAVQAFDYYDQLEEYKRKHGTSEGFEPEQNAPGTSIFDPVLTEALVEWYCPTGGAVLDPFAGGSVRGIVAGRMGRPYTGIELREEQVAENRRQAEAIPTEANPQWIAGDGTDAPELAPGPYDFVLSCPPYADLEVYSERPGDISALSYADFVPAYRQIIANAVGELRPGAYAAWVVSEVRDNRGIYRGFVRDTIEAFQAAGADLWDHAILINATGTLPIRSGRQFSASRKLGRHHQDVLIFRKGDDQ